MESFLRIGRARIREVVDETSEHFVAIVADQFEKSVGHVDISPIAIHPGDVLTLDLRVPMRSHNCSTHNFKESFRSVISVATERRHLREIENADLCLFKLDANMGTMSRGNGLIEDDERAAVPGSQLNGFFYVVY